MSTELQGPPDVGLRQVLLVRVELADGNPRAEAVGVAHRRPRVVPVSIGTASRLAKSGVPLIVHDREVG